MSEERVDTVRLQNLAYGYRQSATLVAAIEIDLFTNRPGRANRRTDRVESRCRAH